jgi:hypothetical protein
MKSLKVFTALSLTGITVEQFTLEAEDILLPRKEVQNAVEKSDPLSVSDVKTMSSKEVERKFGPWLKNDKKLSKYDIFVSSYEQQDKQLAIDLVDMLSNFCYGSKFRAVNVFQTMNLDQNVESLIKSTIIIPFFSINVLFKIKDHNPNQINLVLLEWICALVGLECKQYSRINMIFPFFCGMRDPLTGKLESVLNSEEFKQIPDFVPYATLKEAETLLIQLKLFSETPKGFHSKTVKSIVTEMSKIDGFHVIDDKGTDFLKNAEKVIEFLKSSHFNQVLCYYLLLI